MGRGFGNMISFYLMIGVLLVVLAACCGGPLAFFLWLDGNGGSSGGDGPAQTSTNRPHGDTPAWMRPFVGDYSRHGQSLVIDADGNGLYRSRTYEPCTGPDDPDPLCEPQIGDMPMRVQFTLVRAGDEVQAEVVATNSENHSGRMPISLIRPGVVTFDNMEFCNAAVVSPEDNRDICGA